MGKNQEKPEDQELEVEVEDKKPEQETVTVNLDEKKEEKQQPQYITKDEFDKLHKRNEYTNRKLEKALKQLEEFNSRFTQPREQEIQPQHNAEDILKGRNDVSQFKDSEIETISNKQLDEIAMDNWQLAVDIRTKKVINAQAKQQNRLNEAQGRVKTLENSQKAVLEAFPEITNPDSEVAQAYNEILNEDSSLLSNPVGPEVAMARMIKKYGYKPSSIQSTINSEIETEVQRRQRIGAGSITPARNINSNTVVLTKDQIASAKSNNIPLAQFGKMYQLQQRDFREGVTVDE